MNEIELKHLIESSIKAFLSGSISKNALNLFATLGYKTDRQNPFIEKTYRFFKESFLEPDTSFNEAKARVDDWKSIDLLFQLTQEELSDQQTLFDTKRVDDTIIETYLFFVVELIKTDYSRSALAQITREINKIFPMPVMLLFKYGEHLTLSVINRRLHKKDAQKDVLEKVTLIKDISIQSPHRAHIEILYDLSFDELLRVHKFVNFVELHNAWQKTLDTKELNKRFYQELSNWYFWALDNVSFPDDVESNEDVRNSTNLIRLITRIIFIWFIKEKNLIPNTLFDKSVIKKILKEFLKDKNSNSYYRAILQNLFFGTLNQKMGDRSFAKNGSFLDNKNEYGVKNLFRYDNLFAIDEKESLNLFKDVPFLNGGLFDCLDKPDDSGTILYVDGFSRKPGKQTNIPDFLFFADEQEIDLNKIYDTRNKKYKIKGIINILSNYKFTVTENTPIEEEIALDPELLGKVFENLLASYNPETQATARKQTGSFYTPREIVNYMVDESLKAYLKQKLTNKTDMKSEDADVALDFLFEYNEQDHLFNEKQTKVLIEAIDTCKILDPACGSGAFPMGILLKFVHILHKLDPKNEQWKERQIQKARQIDDVTIREHLITEIKSAFTNNELDYGRKLYLIENCIYGVDIQPIAVQIAKLRFFISLVVDQKKQINEENLGIRALPNLETKFVAANTLIGLEKEKDDWLNNQEIIQLRNELKDIRHQYFSAKTRKKKLIFQKKDKDLRSKIKSILIEIQKHELNEKINNSKEISEIRYYDEMIKRFIDNQKKRTEFETKKQKLSEKLDKIKKSFTGSSEKTAKQLSSWDPYDQNASSPFFDVEWIFDLNDGFDVVIGNPPYISAVSMARSDEEKKYYKRKYPEATGSYDIYVLFLLKTIELTNLNGSYCWIIPNKFLIADYAFLTKKKLINNGLMLSIDVSTFEVFKNTSVYPIIIIGSKNKNNHKAFHELLLDNYIDLEIRKFKIPIILKEHKTFADFKIKFGSGATGFEAGILKKLISEKKKKGAIPFVVSGGIDKYFFSNTNIRFMGLKFEEAYIEFSSNIAGSKWNFWMNPKVVIAGMTKEIESVFVKDCLALGVGAYAIYNWGKFNPKYLTGLLNSKYLSFYIKIKFKDKHLAGGYLAINKSTLEKLPLVFSEEQEKIAVVVDYIQFLKNRNNSKVVFFSHFELLIDAMVYELYFPDEIKTVSAEVLKNLTHLPELKDEWNDEKKLEIIDKVYKELSDPKHPVSIAMEKQKTVPEVRIIEGLPALSEIEGDK